MSSIGSVSSSSGAWATAVQRPQRPNKEELFKRADSDGSGGVDASELQQMLAKRPGAAPSAGGSGATSSPTDAGSAVDFSQLDGDGSGSLDATELDAAMKALMPKPSSTMEFAQQRGMGGLGAPGGQGGSDDLFSKVDGNGDGSIDSDELKTLQDRMGLQDDAAFSRLDTDSSGSLSADEFAAGRPQGGQGGQSAGGTLNVQGSSQGTQGAQGGRGPGGPGGAGGPPPAGGGDGDADDTSTSSSGSTSSSTTIDPLDTNEDGVVSAQERAAGELKKLMEQALKAADSDGDQSLSASELSSLKEAVAQALDKATGASSLSSSGSGSDSSSSSSSGSNQSGSNKLDEQAAKLVGWMLKQYAAGGGSASGSTGSQVNVSA
ncbi:hypothetical protein [Azohydromonas lata]|uniref:hypothetical protein n=1 Tax=Azohydromonas lata TaxID=45677 RepID=UPI00082F51B7|nr:hypothetical protein [Azohydromonas lata]